MFNDRKQLPFGLIGVVIALILILIGTRLGHPEASPILAQKFAPKPTDPNAPPAAPFQLPQVSLPGLPEDVQRQIVALRERLAGGEAVPALTPVAASPRLRVEVRELQRQGDALRVTGEVTNLSNAAVTVPPDAFSFRDSSGIEYAVSGTESSTLAAGQSTSLDLSLPLPPGRGLTLVLTLPPDPPLEQVLIVAPGS